MHMVGYFEGLDSERGIEWRCSDSLSLREFLRLESRERVPDHSWLSKTRSRLPQEVHETVFGWVLALIARHGLIKGERIGVDASTMEANAALRAIVRRDSGEGYRAMLTRLAQESGIETPPADDLIRIDRQRKGKKLSNDEWVSETDPDARIARMKDGTPHLADKPEHAVDLDTGALVAVTVQGADVGDTHSLVETAIMAAEQIEAASAAVSAPLAELVADRGYHSNQTLVDLHAVGVRSYIAEPERGRRCWTKMPEAQAPVYGNRRRVAGDRGRRLMRRRGQYVERSFAHVYDTGGMRRTHLRGHANILKRLLVHAGAFNLGLLMRKMCGRGTPRGLQGRTFGHGAPDFVLTMLLDGLCSLLDRFSRVPLHRQRLGSPLTTIAPAC
jgi:transposase